MSTRGRAISIYLLNGDTSGPIKATIANWTGVAYKIPRTALDSCKDRVDLKQSGVYFLFGIDDQTSKPVVYVGQAGVRKNGEGILYRLSEHKRNPDKHYWTEAVVFTTSNNSFGPTEISYLENRFCNLALTANQYIVKNGNDPTQGNISEEKESELEEFIDFARLLMGVLGHNVFVALDSPPAPTSAPAPQTEEPLLYFQSKRFQATGRRAPQGFLVLKGSKLDPVLNDSCPSSALDARKKHAASIVDDILTETVLLPSPSCAASFVSGSSRSGNISWKTADGVSLGQLE